MRPFASLRALFAELGREVVARRRSGRWWGRARQAPRYEPPVVTPIGNIHDLLQNTCTGHHE